MCLRNKLTPKSRGFLVPMSLCQDRDFLIYRQRLVLFSQDAMCQKFVSLPLSDENCYISMSAEQAEVNLFQVKKKYGQRLESLKDPFVHSSPLLEARSRRFAGNFESSFNLPKPMAMSESQLDVPVRSYHTVKVAPSEGSLLERFGTPQVLDLKIPQKRHSVDGATPSTRRDSIESDSSETKNYYFGKSASVAYENFSDVGTLKKELSEIKELDEFEDVEDVDGHLSVGSREDQLINGSQ